MEKGFRDQGCGASTHSDELQQIAGRSGTGREFKENSERFTGARVIEMNQFVGGKCPLPVIFLCQLRQMTREATPHASQREAAHAPDTDAILLKRLDVADYKSHDSILSRKCTMRTFEDRIRNIHYCNSF